MSEVTRILSAIEAGDPQAAQQLLPLVYDELRRLATAQMAREKPGQTLDATALVHEAYLRLAGAQQFDNRRHFFAARARGVFSVQDPPPQTQPQTRRGSSAAGSRRGATCRGRAERAAGGAGRG